MTEEEKRAHAQRIAEWALEDIEFGVVYEDDELGDCSEEDWREIHNIIRRLAVVSIAEVQQ